jgi:Hsp20/alpha crystallin family
MITARYTEYNIGHYSPTFQLASTIDQSKISAEINDGLATLILPRAATAKPRKIKLATDRHGYLSESTGASSLLARDAASQ